MAQRMIFFPQKRRAPIRQLSAIAGVLGCAAIIFLVGVHVGMSVSTPARAALTAPAVTPASAEL